jgi:serine/threonine protein kinase
VAGAHDQGARLGGLRPTTVLLDPAGPRVLSLGLRRGLAELLRSPPRPARRYQPPEFDPRRRPRYGEDVYALGALMWFALTAEKPPRPAEAGRVPTPPSWKRRRGDLSVLLDPVVLHAMATEPGGRPAHAGELASALAAVAEVAHLSPAARGLVGLPPDDAGFARVEAAPNLLFELLAQEGHR